MTSSATRRASQALPWLAALYAAASLLHFVHNAEHLAHYPNLPSSWSRVDVYLAWCVVTALGIVGYALYLRGYRRAGLSFLALYAILGFAGLLHYTRAPFAHHTSMMNITICTEVAAAVALLVDVLILAARRDRPSAA
ncbi:MAG: hypothetical protein ACLPQ6_03505 [Steroidobacteraceae bacterium]|jgi:hypothetical protein